MHINYFYVYYDDYSSILAVGSCIKNMQFLLRSNSSIWVCVYFLQFVISSSIDSRTLRAAIRDGNSALLKIENEWDIEKYPYFLKSCSATHNSWEYLKLKFRHKILKSAVSKKVKFFNICFTGSSVTAGHDSPYNMSFVPVLSRLMSPVLLRLNVSLQIDNVAIGNNPCFPYSACVPSFCSESADIVVWEQSFFCSLGGVHLPTIEQFIRKASLMRSHPIVALTESVMMNW